MATWILRGQLSENSQQIPENLKRPDKEMGHHLPWQPKEP
jgi:hypothetical protein